MINKHKKLKKTDSTLKTNKSVFFWPRKTIQRLWHPTEKKEKQKYPNLFFVMESSQLFCQTEYLSPFNIYNNYINHIRELNKKRNFDKENFYEEHDVLPLFASKAKKGTPEEGELLKMTFEEHNLAHMYRLFTFNETGDYLTLKMRWGGDSEKAKLLTQYGGAVAGKMNTEAQKLQRKNNLSLHPENLNPSLAGSVQSLAQKTHSKNLGLKYGKQAGMTRQNPITAFKLNHKMIWTHESGVEVIIEKAKTVREVKEILNNAVPGSVKNDSGLSSVLRDVEKKRYGWSLYSPELPSDSMI